MEIAICVDENKNGKQRQQIRTTREKIERRMENERLEWVDYRGEKIRMEIAICVDENKKWKAKTTVNNNKRRR